MEIRSSNIDVYVVDWSWGSIRRLFFYKYLNTYYPEKFHCFTSSVRTPCRLDFIIWQTFVAQITQTSPPLPAACAAIRRNQLVKLTSNPSHPWVIANPLSVLVTPYRSGWVVSLCCAESCLPRRNSLKWDTPPHLCSVPTVVLDRVNT